MEFADETAAEALAWAAEREACQSCAREMVVRMVRKERVDVESCIMDVA